ncbi:STAS domain-containing protein [Kutzneria sp. NPDC052558]|uniref:STAS domain-containing protein n=1 Tax=Kutzneria sp. NPDC052558 TaxID=3364121 RepID=UPI0037CBF297
MANDFSASDGDLPTPADATPPATAAVDTLGPVSVVHVSGEVDMTSRDAVERVLTRTVDGRPEAVVIDLSEVTFFGSSGLQMLAEARVHAAAVHVPLFLVATTRRVLRPLEITGLTMAFTVYATVADAVSADRG